MRKFLKRAMNGDLARCFTSWCLMPARAPPYPAYRLTPPTALPPPLLAPTLAFNRSNIPTPRYTEVAAAKRDAARMARFGAKFLKGSELKAFNRWLEMVAEREHMKVGLSRRTVLACASVNAPFPHRSSPGACFASASLRLSMDGSSMWRSAHASEESWGEPPTGPSWPPFRLGERFLPPGVCARRLPALPALPTGPPCRAFLPASTHLRRLPPCDRLDHLGDADKMRSVLSRLIDGRLSRGFNRWIEALDEVCAC